MYFMTNGRDPVTLPSGWAAKPQLDFHFTLATLEQTYDRFPTQVIVQRRALSVYRLQNGALPEDIPGAYPLTVDIGSLDDLYLGDGFYGKEWLSDDLSVRWTGRQAELLLPALGNAKEIKLSLRLGRSQGGDLKLGPLSILANDQPLGTITPHSELTTYTLTAPVPVQPTDRDEFVLILEADTWEPKDLGISADERDLGIMLDWIKIETEP
jgi:hypothetical protein